MKRKIFTHLIAASLGFWAAELSRYFSQHEIHLTEGRLHS